jgi:hypothetical protein
MFDVSAEFYDLIYATFKDYRTEAGQIASLYGGSILRARHSWTSRAALASTPGFWLTRASS